ncbi:histidine kinase [Streptomyces sp. NPDC046203]|uniref:sensor histidine kinase n=1 Tax=Streptomyces sp. NPDC046203 TaxID=3154602 RepID=UPI00340A1B5A
MGQLGTWAARAAVGFVRACAVAAVTLVVPAVWTAAALLGVHWGAANPWSWLLPLVLVTAGTLALSRPVCGAVRALVARWTGTVVPAGHRQGGPVVRMATGYWWNGFSYERTRRDALLDQRWRIRWSDPATWRDLRFTAIAPVTAGLVAAVPPAGLAVAALYLTRPGAAARLAGALGLLVAVGSAPYAWRPVRRVAVRFLGPSRAMALADRVGELAVRNADMTIAQAAEIRRIERDLHDGAQARLVALGLSLATAERLMDADPGRAKELMRDARAGAAGSLAELRELVRGISPPVLTERGLADAVRALALDLPLDVDVRVGPGVPDGAAGSPRLEPPVESAVYFGVAELLTNTVKHARATHACVTLALAPAPTPGGFDVVAEVSDDGRGGAVVPPGGGLDGLRRRLAAFDGTLEIASPPGGPTRAGITVPCAYS